MISPLNQHLAYPVCMQLQTTVIKFKAKSKSVSHNLTTTLIHRVRTSYQESLFLSNKQWNTPLNFFFPPALSKRSCEILLYSHRDFATVCYRALVADILSPRLNYLQKHMLRIWLKNQYNLYGMHAVNLTFFLASYSQQTSSEVVVYLSKWRVLLDGFSFSKVFAYHKNSW